MIYDISSDDCIIFRRTPRVFHERGNPFIEVYNNQFKKSFRLPKFVVVELE